MFNFFSKLNVIIALGLFLISSNIYATTKIGIIVPLEHEAMTQIVSGIKESLVGEDVDLIITNAHGDANIMSTIIRQMDEQNIEIVIPIATYTSQMAISHIKDKPIICTAANIHPQIGSKVTGVNDEVPTTTILREIPSLKKLAIIYSANEKIASEVEELQNYAVQNNIKLHLVMVQSLAELPVAIRNVPDDIMAFLVLKDSLIVSGINILVQEAEKREIPVITSDEGSVLRGATMAIGIREKDIGISAGLIAKDILHGKNPSSIPYQTLQKLSLFINLKAFEEQNILTREMLKNLSLPEIEFERE